MYILLILFKKDILRLSSREKDFLDTIEKSNINSIAQLKEYSENKNRLQEAIQRAEAAEDRIEVYYYLF